MIPRPTKAATYLFLLLVYLILIIPFSPLFGVLGYDREIFQYMGMILANGDLPYTDAFDHKPPGIYILNYLGFLLTPNSTWGIFLILNCLGFYLVILVHSITKKVTGDSLMAIFIAVVFMALMNHPYILEGGNLSRQVTAYLTVLIAYIVFTRKPSTIASIVLGVILGTIFFFQQNEILAPSVLVGAYIFFTKKGRLNPIPFILRHSGFLLLGVLFRVLLTGLVIYSWGNWDDFIDQAFLFNLGSYIQKAPLLQNMGKTILAGGYLGIIAPVILLGIGIILVHVIRKRSIRFEFFVICIAVLFQLIATSLSGRADGHYFLMFVPFLALGMIFTSVPMKQKFMYGLSLALAVLLIVQLKTSYQFSIQLGQKHTTLLSQVNNEVGNIKGNKGQFYTFDPRFLRTNFNLNIPSPSKWIYTHFAYSAYDPEGKIIDEIIRSLERYKTSYVLVNDSERDTKVDAYLAMHYQQKLHEGEYVLYIRKEE